MPPDQLYGSNLKYPAARAAPRSRSRLSIRLRSCNNHDETIPQSLNRFQQRTRPDRRVPFIGVTQGDADRLHAEPRAATLPQGYSVTYAGPSRQYVQESSALIITFLFALVVIFLALAAQSRASATRSIILVSVPMSICGALIFVNLFGTLGIGAVSLNIYTKVGLVTLIGLISKHGILIVEFANNLQRQGQSKRRSGRKRGWDPAPPDPDDHRRDGARRRSASYRERCGRGEPLQHGAGDRDRGRHRTLFTLFVVPAMYVLLAEDHSKRAAGDALPEPGGHASTH